MNVPQELRYTKEHEWVRIEGNRAVIGITDYAQSELGDVVFVEMPEIGKQVQVNGILTTIESVKAVSDIYAPVTGTVVEVNDTLADKPELVNEAPYGEGWIVVIEMDRSDTVLLDAAQYRALLGEGA